MYNTFADAGFPSLEKVDRKGGEMIKKEGGKEGSWLEKKGEKKKRKRLRK